VVSLALGGLDCVQLPGVGNALELVGAAVVEGEAGPGDQVLDRARAQHLPRLGLGEDAGRDMHGDPAEVVADQLDLAGVQASPDLEAVLGQLSPDGVGGPDGPGRAVEAGQEPVPRSS
jgi:hypothetical protein